MACRETPIFSEEHPLYMEQNYGVSKLRQVKLLAEFRHTSKLLQATHAAPQVDDAAPEWDNDWGEEERSGCAKLRADDTKSSYLDEFVLLGIMCQTWNQVGRFHEEWSDLLGLLRRKATQSPHGKQLPTRHMLDSPGKPGGMWWIFFAPQKRNWSF